MSLTLFIKYTLYRCSMAITFFSNSNTIFQQIKCRTFSIQLYQSRKTSFRYFPFKHAPNIPLLKPLAQLIEYGMNGIAIICDNIFLMGKSRIKCGRRKKALFKHKLGIKGFEFGRI